VSQQEMIAEVTKDSRQTAACRPLVVDLDGTLIYTDTLHESVIALLRVKPFHTLLIPAWLMSGKAALKARLSSLTNFYPASLPYNQALIAWLKEKKQQGRELVLCTASNEKIAQAVARHLDLFDTVLSTSDEKNLAGKHKAELLAQKYGHGGFDYVGNSAADIEVWRVARNGIVVNASQAVIRQAKSVCNVEKVIDGNSATIKTWVKVFRLHQWVKNLLLFIPLLAAHQFANTQSLSLLASAFMSFSLCASSVYIANDLLDLESDRRHSRKKIRPFAAGSVAVWKGVVLAPILAFASIGIATTVGMDFLAWLLVYVALTCVYSLWLKRLVLIDCLTLAGLYTLRIMAGAAAATVALSFWLLTFSIFIFLSLAFVKRYAELKLQESDSKARAHGRGYYTADLPIVQMLGITAGNASVLVLALYLQSESVRQHYSAPEFLWAVVPLMLFWVSWMWIKAHRGQMHDDPIVFASRDKASMIVGALLIVVFVAASLVSARARLNLHIGIP
jgi:4-hydroxybenzoate polyprenyltransferase/phosphoserine phosphatase